jgi:hypothetical protein
MRSSNDSPHILIGFPAEDTNRAFPGRAAQRAAGDDADLARIDHARGGRGRAVQMIMQPSPASNAKALPAPRAARKTRATRAGMRDLWASGDRRRPRPARILRGARDLPWARPRKTHRLGPLGPSARLNGSASACRRRSATRAGRSRTSASTSMPAASSVLRSTSSSARRSNPDPSRSASMSLVMRPSVPRGTPRELESPQPPTGAADRPDSRARIRGARCVAATPSAVVELDAVLTATHNAASDALGLTRRAGRGTTRSARGSQGSNTRSLDREAVQLTARHQDRLRPATRRPSLDSAQAAINPTASQNTAASP